MDTENTDTYFIAGCSQRCVDEDTKSSPLGGSITQTSGACVRKKHGNYPMSVKLRAVSMSSSGLGSLTIGKEMGIESSVIRGWVRKYKKYGIDGLKTACYRNMPNRCGNAASEEPETPNNLSKRGFVRHVDNQSLMRIMVGRLSSYGIRQENIEVWESFSDYLKTIKDGETVVVNSLFDISTDISTLITLFNTLFASNITLISLEDGGTAILSEGLEPGTLLRILHNYVTVADRGTLTAVRSAAVQTADEPVVEKEINDDRFTKAYGIWCDGGSMAYAARASGCSYSSFRYWIMKNYRNRTGQTAKRKNQ